MLETREVPRRFVRWTRAWSKEPARCLEPVESRAGTERGAEKRPRPPRQLGLPSLFFFSLPAPDFLRVASGAGAASRKPMVLPLLFGRLGEETRGRN